MAFAVTASPHPAEAGIQARNEMVYSVFGVSSVMSHLRGLAEAFTRHFRAGDVPTAVASYASIAGLPVGGIALIVSVVVVSSTTSTRFGAKRD